MGSNPIPRAILRELNENGYIIKDTICYGRNIALSHNQAKNNNINNQTQGERDKSETEILAPINRKINSITKSCSKPYFNSILKKLAVANYENADTICEYITAEETEINIKNSTKEAKIKVITWLSNFYDNKINLRQMTKQDILGYLNSLRKPFDEDPSQRWIGSYNGRQMILSKFFRWLYNPNEPDERKRATPLCMKGIKQLPRKEITPYSPSDLWEPREHNIFLKYCPSVRDRCYHALANDMSARPHEILNLKIKDIMFRKTEDGNKQYAEVLIKGGKTKPRTIPLIDSLPYVKELINTHPTASNANSWLFVSNSNSTFGSKLTYDGISYQYKSFYKKRYFPKLLEIETTPKPDKDLIRNMLSKPWNLYVFRHSALTEKSQVLKEHVLRDHAGWTMSSKMPQVYIHYFGNESAKSLLEIKGIIRKENIDQVNILKSISCPNCLEPNKPNSRICASCKMILSYNVYTQTIEEKQKNDKTILELQEKYEKDMRLFKEDMENKIQQLTLKVNFEKLETT